MLRRLNLLRRQCKTEAGSKRNCLSTESCRCVCRHGGLAGKRRGEQEGADTISRDDAIAELRAALINLPTTIAALETVDRLITYYRDCRPEVIEVRFERGSSLDVIQLDRDMALELLTHKRQSLVDYLASLGIAA